MISKCNVILASILGYSLLMNIVIYKVKINIINLLQLRVLFNIILDVIWTKLDIK